MSKKLIRYPSIDQFRNIVREVKFNCDYKGKNEQEEPIYEHTEEYPTIKFEATVKLHGTNAAIGIDIETSEIFYQSRNNIINLENDNFGFVAEMAKWPIGRLFVNIKNVALFLDTNAQGSIIYYGEWCGKGIQQGVGIESCERMFVIFGCKIDDRWSELPASFKEFRKINGAPIYSIYEFPTWNFSIDFNHPELVQNDIIELTNQVEDECPVAKQFGFSGIGEGIVLKGFHKGHHYMFKSKGDKHSVSKVKKLASVDVEKISNAQEFVTNTVTENRLKQGLENIPSKEIRHIKEFIDWIKDDVFKEETDTIVQNGLDAGIIAKEIMNVARKWYLTNLK